MKESTLKRLSWKRIAAIYFNAAPGSSIRKKIISECRRCGYTPRVILSLHREEA